MINKKEYTCRGSLTVEASLITWPFVLFILSFLYLIQIFTIQEHIQSSITRMGLDLAQMSYIFDDFNFSEEAEGAESLVGDIASEIGLSELIASSINSGMLKLYSSKYIDKMRLDSSSIVKGFDGLSFYESSVLKDDDFIDIIVKYKIRLPIKLFPIDDMEMVQRVKLRGWTGIQFSPNYTLNEDSDEDTIVYVAKTGSVYHRNKSCSHIKLSVRGVQGIPSQLRNDNGGKYYPCEKCCKEDKGISSTYYITSDGTRYHSIIDCSKIKRTVNEVHLSSVVDSKSPCKRCGN
ncbi:MAG TPA: hypothetical protein GXZ21_10695 [Clostridiales bacterium]|nr:hypothetical protein [Clostridiales bacterium]